MSEEGESLDPRGRNLTFAVVGVVALVIVGVIANNYRVKSGWIADMKGAVGPARTRAAQSMMARGDVSEQLQGEPPSVRAAAVRAISSIETSQAAENLIPFMKDGDQPVRERAIQGVIDLQPKIALTRVIDKGFADSDDNVRKGAIAVCKEFGAICIEPAAKRLATDYRKPAAEALVEIRNKDGSTRPEIVRVVAPYVGPANPLDPTMPAAEETRNQAIDVLDRAGDESAVPALIAALEYPQTRRSAVGALGRKKDSRATDALLRWLGSDDTVRHEVVIALGQIGDPRAIQPLIRYGLGSASISVRAAASDALRSIGPASVPALREILSRAARFSTAQRVGAARALAGMRDPAAISAALGALADRDSAVREAAADSLGESRDPGVIPALSREFTDPDPNGRVQAAAARSLSAFGSAAIPTLEQALASADNARAYWAGQALLLIGRPAVRPLTELMLRRDARAAARAARLLGDLGDPAAAGALREAMRMKHDAEFQFAARTALQRLSEDATRASG